MTLYIKPQLSKMIIDVDKDWSTYGLSDLSEVASGMTKGDIIFFDGTRIVKLSPGSIGKMLTTQGMGADPTWG